MAQEAFVAAAGVVRVREVVEDDRAGQVEQLPLALEEAALQALVALPQPVVGAIQFHERGGPCAVEREQFEQGAVGAQPVQRLALGGGVQHARRDQGGGDGGVARGEAGLLQQGGQAELVEGVQAEALAADRAGVLEAGGGAGLDEAGGAQAADQLLGGGAHLGIAGP